MQLACFFCLIDPIKIQRMGEKFRSVVILGEILILMCVLLID